MCNRAEPSARKAGYAGRRGDSGWSARCGLAGVREDHEKRLPTPFRHRPKKGVLITTSSFTREAREFGDHIADSVVLIDGSRLTSLMIENGVGVTHSAIKLSRIDGDYFADT